MSPLEIVAAFETFHSVAKRVCSDEDVANDIAMEEFEKFLAVRNPKSEHGKNVRAYAWKVVAAKWKEHLKRQWSHITESRFDEDDKFHNILPPCRAGQEDYVEARQMVPLIERLPDGCREAMRILCGGGSVADVMRELDMSPKGALYAITEARRQIALMLNDNRPLGSAA